MCRIFGYLGNQPIDNSIMINVSNLQKYGGPDDQTFINYKNFGLGNNRLAIVDLEGGKQPYKLGDVYAVFNGEIYNHQDLRKTLIQKGYKFTDQCDGSIIPAMYLQYGDDFVKYLDGMFSIAIIDLRNSTKLTLFTDPCGVKTLYYYWDNTTKTLFFSSEITALLGFKYVPKQLWLAGVDSYLTTKSILGNRTLFNGINVLCPSSQLTLLKNGLPKVKDYKTKINSNFYSDDFNDSSHQLRSQLFREVKHLLTSDVPVAMVNSGGLDSSLLTSMACELKNNIHSFNVSYLGNWPFDEKYFARQVSKYCHTNHHEVQINPNDFPRIIVKMIRHLGQPNADPITLSSYSLFKAIHETGFKVAITGDGADELFGGYQRFIDVLRSPKNMWVDQYCNNLSALQEKTRWKLYSEDYKSFLIENGKASDIIKNYLLNSKSKILHTILSFEQKYRLPSYHLRRIDHLSMAHSVEARVPYCQPKMVDFSRKIKDSFKIKGASGKRILHNSAKNLLPKSVLLRKKQPFTLPISIMIQYDSALYNFICDVLEKDTIMKQNIFNYNEIQKVLDRQIKKPNPIDSLSLWSLMIFQLWIITFNINIGTSKEFFEEGRFSL